MSSSLSKRKLDDHDDDEFPANLNRPARFSTRMRKDQNTLPSSSSLRSPLSDPTRIQFFVRTISKRTLVLISRSTDTVRSIHEKLQSSTGMPIIEQRLIYCGKQLKWEQTLHECGVENDAELHLVGRMRSTSHPQAWQLINELVSLIFCLYKNNGPTQLFPPPRTVKAMLLDFLGMVSRADDDQAKDHIQIFTTSSAPRALVMLYMSSSQTNRDVAEDAIKQFVTSSKTIVPMHTYHQSLHIFLEFCNLLSKSAGINDGLYVYCRSSLGTLVECNEVWERKGLVGLHDIFPFARELAAKLGHDLALSTESTSFVGPSMTDVRDFAAFLVPVRNEIKESVAFCGPVEIPLSKDFSTLPIRYAEEITYLYSVFIDLLERVEKCLEKIEEHMDLVAMKQDGETLFFGWCQYLGVLKELNNISELYIGCKELFQETMKRRKGALCYLIARYAKRSDDHQWITECKELTNFEARRHLAMITLPEVKDEYEELHEMLIDRSNLLAESFRYITSAESEALRAGLFMEFKNEEATGPGVLREWFFLVCQAIFNPQNALFVACPNDRRRFFPNPVSKVDPLHLEYFNFAGRVIALSLMHKVQIGIVLDRAFFLQLAGHEISLEDIRDADPYLYSSCKQILEMDPEAVDQDTLGLTFVHEIEELGTRKVVELCPGGKRMAVNSRNRKAYVDALVQHRFVKAVGEQVKYFAQGFADIMSSNKLQRSFFQLLEPEDLDCMLHGSESTISVDDWKAHTEYHGYKETDSQISWFWKIVECMSTEQKKVLLFFWTSIKYLPTEGFGGLASRLYIYKTSESTDRLPSSHTCFHRLCFPDYPSLSVMSDRLNIITQEHIACSFGTW